MSANPTTTTDTPSAIDHFLAIGSWVDPAATPSGPRAAAIDAWLDCLNAIADGTYDTPGSTPPALITDVGP